MLQQKRQGQQPRQQRLRQRQRQQQTSPQPQEPQLKFLHQNYYPNTTFDGNYHQQYLCATNKRQQEQRHHRYQQHYPNRHRPFSHRDIEGYETLTNIHENRTVPFVYEGAHRERQSGNNSNNDNNINGRNQRHHKTHILYREQKQRKREQKETGKQQQQQQEDILDQWIDTTAKGMKSFFDFRQFDLRWLIPIFGLGAALSLFHMKSKRILSKQIVRCPNYLDNHNINNVSDTTIVNDHSNTKNTNININNNNNNNDDSNSNNNNNNNNNNSATINDKHRQNSNATYYTSQILYDIVQLNYSEYLHLCDATLSLQHELLNPKISRLLSSFRVDNCMDLDIVCNDLLYSSSCNARYCYTRGNKNGSSGSSSSGDDDDCSYRSNNIVYLKKLTKEIELWCEIETNRLSRYFKIPIFPVKKFIYSPNNSSNSNDNDDDDGSKEYEDYTIPQLSSPSQHRQQHTPKLQTYRYVAPIGENKVYKQSWRYGICLIIDIQQPPPVKQNNISDERDHAMVHVRLLKLECEAFMTILKSETIRDMGFALNEMCDTVPVMEREEKGIQQQQESFQRINNNNNNNNNNSNTSTASTARIHNNNNNKSGSDIKSLQLVLLLYTRPLDIVGV
jgi:hypothetical protein